VSSLKNILVVTVLLGVGYAVYTTINSQPEPTRPSDQTDGWPTTVDVQIPSGNDTKSATKNPFAARSDQGTERVPARDADSLKAPRANPSSSDTARSPLPPSDRASRPFSAGESRPVPPPQESGPRSGGPPRPPDNGISPDGPGVAMTTDLPTHSPSAGDARHSPPSRKPDAASSKPATGVRKEFVAMMEEAQRRLANGQLAEVHLALSRLYGNPELTGEESQQLIELLDQLTGTVVYSRQHLLEPAYVVKADDTLERIAKSYNVPWRLLAKINGVRDPQRLQPGSQLKVVRGPFEATVSLSRFELVLMLGDRYAGRFPIGTGRDNPRLEGTYPLRKKVVDPPYIASDCKFEPGDPNNPLGKFWLELGDRLAIHGTNDIKNLRRSDGRGTICLGPRDIEDLCDILTASDESALASKVIVRR